ncbi:MAG: DUF2851 family protein [Salibacteraceae bacterium]
MTEAFLQYVWRFGLFDNRQLPTSAGRTIEIIALGDLNTDAGPDFFNAQIRLGETHWVGNIEIHLKSSDWAKHRHHQDSAYNNVILHVVETSDGEAKTENGRTLPEVAIGQRIRKDVLSNYRNMLENGQWVACQPRLQEVEPLLVNTWVTRMVVERLQRKSAIIERLLDRNQQDWAEAFYQILARNFGFKTNAEPFEQLARSLPFKYLARHRDDPFQLEALIFGQAGMLSGAPKDDYQRQLQGEYHYLQHKYDLRPLEVRQWKFARLRPSNFPSVRLAQFAQLIHLWDAMFSKVLEAPRLSDLETIFQIKAGAYWDTHYHFGRTSRKQVKRIGKMSVHNLFINTVVPFLFTYGRHRGKPSLEERALAWLELLPSENNTIVRGWQDIGVGARSAFRSQGLLELKSNYCNRKNCVNCSIGNRLLKSPHDR